MIDEIEIEIKALEIVKIDQTITFALPSHLRDFINVNLGENYGFKYSLHGSLVKCFQ